MAVGIASIAGGCGETSAAGAPNPPGAQPDNDGGQEPDAGQEPAGDQANESPQISATMRNDHVYLWVGDDPPLFHVRQCGDRGRDQVELQRANGTRLLDQRPRYWPSQGYTLDGVFVQADIGEGCAMPCERLPAELHLGRAVEYALVDATGAAPEVETVPFHGELRVVLRYALDDECAELLEAAATIAID